MFVAGIVAYLEDVEKFLMSLVTVTLLFSTRFLRSSQREVVWFYVKRSSSVTASIRKWNVASSWMSNICHCHMRVTSDTCVEIILHSSLRSGL